MASRISVVSCTPGARWASSGGSSGPAPVRKNTMFRTEFRQQIYVRPRHPAMQNIADDGYAQPFQRAAAVENGARVNQGLRGVFVCVPSPALMMGVGKWRSQKMRRAGCGMPHHDRDRDASLPACSAYPPKDSPSADAGTGRSDADGVRAQAFRGDFKAGARAR